MSTSSAGPRRRVAIAVAATAAALVTSVISASPAHAADDPNTLTVVGTSDVFDSNLIQTVIKPGFEAANPGVTLNYISKGTGAAIAYAEAGSASALVVHAPSLENQYVAAGYSSEPAGRAIFWGDYVVLGPNSDPLDIGSKYPHNVAGAFQRIAAQGALGNANFVSRGGTPGTTVQEHAIWALTTGVTLCKVSDVNGGGYSPSTTTGDCPATISYPSWYHATGLTQGPNIVNADACNYPNGNCYVLTDRGTFNYLQSTGAAQNLKIVTRDNSPGARGGVPLLVNSFHAYSVNPAAFPPDVAAGINQTQAINFLNYVTSPAAQTAIGNYLNGDNDPPFLPDAAPTISTTALPASVSGNKTVTLRGTLTNVVPGTPPLANQPVSLVGTDGTSVTSTIAATTTDSAGKYVFKFIPKATRTYKVKTPRLTMLEYPLSPPFSDILAPGSANAGSIEVVGAPSITSGSATAGSLKVSFTLAPPPVDGSSVVQVLASKDGGAEAPLGNPIAVAAGKSSVTHQFNNLDSGSYTYRISYEDGPYISQGFSATRTTVVP